MRKSLIGICAAACLLLQLQPALADCAPGELDGKWNLTGTFITPGGASSMQFFCAALSLEQAGNSNKYKVTGKCSARQPGQSPTVFNIGGPAKLSVNNACKMDGSFFANGLGEDGEFRIVSARVEDKPGNGKSLNVRGIIELSINTIIFSMVR